MLVRRFKKNKTNLNQEQQKIISVNFIKIELSLSPVEKLKSSPIDKKSNSPVENLFNKNLK